MEPGAPAAVTLGASSLSETMWQHVRARPWITACWLTPAPRTSTWQCSTVMLGEVRLSPVPEFGKFFPVQGRTGCMVTCSTPCSAATSNHMEHRRERQPLCHLAQPPPGQMAKDTASPQGGRTGGGNRGDICCCRISGDTGLPSTAQTFDSLELDQLGLGCGTGKQRLRDVGLLSLEDEADGILGLFAAALQGGAMRWSWGPLTGTW